MLEGLMRHPDVMNADVRRKVADFTKLFWANRGNHNEMTAQKFLPEFSPEELKTAAHAAFAAGAFRGAAYDGGPLTESALDKELAALRASIFDPAFEPLI